MKKQKKKSIEFFTPPVPEKPKHSHIDLVKGLFRYFGYRLIQEKPSGFLDFAHHSIPGIPCFYAPWSGKIGRIQFMDGDGFNSIYPETWQGLFRALRARTRRCIAMQDANYKQKAA